MMIGFDMKTKRLLALVVAGLAMVGYALELIIMEAVEGHELTFDASWEDGETRTALRADG